MTNSNLGVGVVEHAFILKNFEVGINPRRIQKIERLDHHDSNKPLSAQLWHKNFAESKRYPLSTEPCAGQDGVGGWSNVEERQIFW
jgi:hypothetical protein